MGGVTKIATNQFVQTFMNPSPLIFVRASDEIIGIRRISFLYMQRRVISEYKLIYIFNLGKKFWSKIY